MCMEGDGVVTKPFPMPRVKDKRTKSSANDKFKSRSFRLKTSANDGVEDARMPK